MGEMILDLEGGGMEFVVISGILRLRLMTFVWWIGNRATLELSISSGDCRVETESDCWSSRFWRCGSVISSADRRLRLMETRGAVWLRGLRKVGRAASDHLPTHRAQHHPHHQTRVPIHTTIVSWVLGPRSLACRLVSPGDGQSGCDG